MVASQDLPLEVVFRWQNAALGWEGYFLWRQGNGMRRWDVVHVEAGKPVTGSVSIETDLTRGLTMGYPRLGCLWMTGDSHPGRVFAICSSSAPLEFLPVERALYSEVGDRLKDRTIAGRSASCYPFTHPGFSLAAFCVGSSDGIPLLFTTESLVDPLFSQSMEAISVSTAEPNLAIPFGLEADPRGSFPHVEEIVPLSDLGLPDLSGLSE